MGHCPYCGTQVEEHESFCINCGKHLPDDMKNRLQDNKLDKFWYIPAGALLIMVMAIGISYFILDHKTSTALDLYKEGTVQIQAEHYEKGKELFKDALAYHPSFTQAQTAFEFTASVMNVNKNIDKAQTAAQDQDFQSALSLVNEAEKSLDNYSGNAVVPIIDRLSKQRDSVRTIQLKKDMQKEPSIQDLKMLLWDAEGIATDEAKQIANTIRERIIDYTHAKASEQINDHHFKDAKIIVEDGLKYAPESEKLISLETTIGNERDAFETMQQERIEQAINTAVEEQEINENDAIELVDVSAENDEQGNLLVTGEVKSVATIPINTISVEYALTTKDGEEFSTHHVYVYPDTLYPGETGQFEFTHYDIQDKGDDISAEVDTIKWYTN